MKIALIMLAAGNSQRFGENKLLYKIHGKPMYQHVLTCLSEFEQNPLTVVTQYREIGDEAASLGARVLYNPFPERGISSSLKIGLEANLDADACLFAVSDQPWLTRETVAGLMQSFLHSQKGIACVRNDEKMGNPCIFSKKYFKELMELTGDVGGKRVIRAHEEDTDFFYVKNQKELEDIDKKVTVSES